jgi:hypothetical protein
VLADNIYRRQFSGAKLTSGWRVNGWQLSGGAVACPNVRNVSGRRRQAYLTLQPFACLIVGAKT